MNRLDMIRESAFLLKTGILGARHGKYRCSHCGRQGMSVMGFKAHMRAYHGDTVAGHGWGLSNKVTSSAHKPGPVTMKKHRR